MSLLSIHFMLLWQEVTRMHRTNKKDLNDPDNHDDVITHLEPDILQCEAKLVEAMESWLSYFKS